MLLKNLLVGHVFTYTRIDLIKYSQLDWLLTVDVDVPGGGNCSP